jgi:ornithine cyclodeaminase
MRIKAFTARDIDRALSMAEAVEVVKDAFAQLSLKKAQSPVRISLNLRQAGEAALVMPAYMEESGALGAKMVTVLPTNPRAGLPAVQGIVFLFDAAKGSPLAILEGTHLTRFRTGAATGAATQLLSRPDSRSLAVFGAGGQAFFQVQGVLAARKIESLRVFDLLPEKAEELIQTLRADASCRRIELLPARTPGQALEGADVVVTATTSGRPVFDGRQLKEGAHINAIGAFKPEMQEVDEETLRRARIFVDSVKACLEEAGDLIIPLKKGLIQEADIVAELGEVAAGKKPGRGSVREITYFKSVGNAVQDIAVAQAVYQRSLGRNLGQEVDL